MKPEDLAALVAALADLVDAYTACREKYPGMSEVLGPVEAAITSTAGVIESLTTGVGVIIEGDAPTGVPWPTRPEAQ